MQWRVNPVVDGKIFKGVKQKDAKFQSVYVDHQAVLQRYIMLLRGDGPTACLRSP